MSEKYKIRDQDKPYFITISVVEWIDVFTRPGKHGSNFRASVGMINTLKRSTMILGTIFTLMMLMQNCDTATCMEDYYTANQVDLTAIRAASQTLSSNCEYVKITIRKKSGKLELRFYGGAVDNVTMYINPTDLSLISEHPVDECSPVVLDRFRTMYNDATLRTILQLFAKIEPNAVRINSKGVFVALGETLKHPNKGELEGGIFMAFASGFTSQWVISEIDTNVYLFDTLIY
ncbi:MAG: hypothetical protein OEW67_14075 [Cyclobacteriaceae bacterium]|nr:hypothetical protein [Cyclobacteriaceae bacterium]